MILSIIEIKIIEKEIERMNKILTKIIAVVVIASMLGGTCFTLLYFIFSGQN